MPNGNPVSGKRYRATICLNGTGSQYQSDVAQPAHVLTNSKRGPAGRVQRLGCILEHDTQQL